MMKHCPWLLVLLFLFPMVLKAQCDIFNHYPFLSFNHDTHYKSLADIGVISSGYADEIVAWKKNPSLLSQKEKIFLVETNSSKNGDLYGNTFNLNGQFQFRPKWAVGLDASLVPYQATLKYDNWTRVTHPSEQYEVTTSFAYSIGKNFSIGGGLSYFSTNVLRSKSTNGSNGLSDIITKGFIFQFGGNYNREILLNEEEKLVFEIGLSFNTLGGKASFGGRDSFDSFLPGEFLLGGRIGWEGNYADKRSIGVNLLAQLDHSLEPECDFATDEDQSGIPDYFEINSLAATIGSFGDHPDGFSGEIRKMNKRIALEPYIDISEKWKFGFGVGYAKVNINEEKQEEFLTMGINGSYQNFKLNIYRQESIDQNETSSYPWGLSLAYSKVLTKQ